MALTRRVRAPISATTPMRGAHLREMTALVAERVFPTLTEPLRSADDLRRHVGDDDAWKALFERPLGEYLEERFSSDTIRGIVLTDAVVGTFAERR